MVVKKREYLEIRRRMKELNSVLYDMQLLQSESVRDAMRKLRDELNMALTRTEETKYEKLAVGDFFLDQDGVRKRKFKFDLDIGSVAVVPGHSADASCLAPSQLVKKIVRQ